MGLSSKERALLYALRLKDANYSKAEAEKIRADLDGLVLTTNNQPLTKEAKLEILTETRSIVKSGAKTPDGKSILEASDNSGTLDIIDSIIDQTKK